MHCLCHFHAELETNRSHQNISNLKDRLRSYENILVDEDQGSVKDSKAKPVVSLEKNYDTTGRTQENPVLKQRLV